MLFLACDWWKVVKPDTSYTYPLEAVMNVTSLGVTRLHLVTPRVYYIHHSFLGSIYLSTPSEYVMYVISLGVTRVRLVTPLVISHTPQLHLVLSITASASS